MPNWVVERRGLKGCSASPSTSLAVGWNAYAWFTDAVVAGVPKIVGGVLGAGPTVSVNGRARSSSPSVTLIVTVDEVLASATSGVPLNRPVAVSNTAQLGGPWMLNVSASPSTSFAVGWNAYAWYRCGGGRCAQDRRRRVRRGRGERERCERGRRLAIGHADR